MNEETVEKTTEQAATKTERNSFGLSDPQIKAIEMIAEGRLYKDIAAELGIHVNTLQGWRKNKNFTKILGKQRKEAVKGAQNVMATNASYAAQRIVEMMDDPEATRTQLAAAVKVYEFGTGTTIEELEERIAKIEESITRHV